MQLLEPLYVYVWIVPNICYRSRNMYSINNQRIDYISLNQKKYIKIGHFMRVYYIFK